MKTIFKIVLIALLIFAIISAAGMVYLMRGLDEGSRLKIGTVNLSSVSDGTYKGKYDGGRWSNEISVTVKDHKISKIEIIKDVKFPKAGIFEELTDKIIKKQNTDVDVVSGSTVTSKAYLKSIENALKK